MLADVRQALARRRSRRPPRAARAARSSSVDRQPHRHGRARGELLERDREAVPADDGRMDAPRDVAQLLERRRDLAPRLVERGPRVGVVAEPLARAGRARATARSSRCCAPSCRLRSSRWRSFWPASITRAREPRSSSRRARSSACSRAFSSAIAGRRADRVEQLGLVVQRRVVHERRDVLAVPVDQRRRSAVAGSRQLDGSAVEVGPALELAAASTRASATGRAARARARRADRRAPDRARSSTTRSPTAERASRARSRPTRNATGARPIDDEGGPPDRLERRCRSKAADGRAAGRRSSRARGRRSRRAAPASGAAAGPAPRRRAASTTMPASAERAERDELDVAAPCAAAPGSATTSSRLSGPKPPSAIPTSCRPIAAT